MPRPRRSNLSPRSRNAIRQRNIASQLSDEERKIVREKRRVSMEQRRALIRVYQTHEQREAARETARLEMKIRRRYRTDKQRKNLRGAIRNGSSITRRNRTASISGRALGNPLETGKIKSFCRESGHGFVRPEKGGEDLFVHISDIEGEYVPLPGDEVIYRLCPIPPEFKKNQAVHVTHLKCENHLKWDEPPVLHS